MTMDIQLTDRQLSLLKDIAKQEGFEHFELKTTAGTVEGDNYLGRITQVILEDGERKLDLIMKSVSAHPNIGKHVSVRTAYLREIYLYGTIFPAIQAFQEEQGFSKGFSGYAKLYGSCANKNNEAVILENLKEIGYSMWNRKVPMDTDHIELVLKEYGKFHAASLALREKKPDLYKKLTNELDPVFDILNMNNMPGTGVQVFIEKCVNVVQGNQVATDALVKFSLEADKYFLDGKKAEEEELVVLHGDCWCNNFMFKYEDSGQKRPSKICLIDWQLSSRGSPAKDLAYFLFACAPKKILADYRRYLKIYHDTVCECLTRLDCDPETVFPFDLLEHHWRKHAKFGIFMALLTLRLTLREGSEVNKSDTYKQRIVDIVMVAVENSWL